MLGGINFIKSWRNCNPAIDLADERFGLNEESNNEPPPAQTMRINESADCVSPLADCNAYAYFPSLEIFGP